MSNANDVLYGRIKARLRMVYRGDFRKSEPTLLDEALAELKKQDIKFRDNDCVLMLSGNQKILKFVFPYLTFNMMDSRGNTVVGRKTRVLPSRAYRILDHGTFNPLMLANYAEELGIELEHIKRFEAYLKEEILEAAA